MLAQNIVLLWERYIDRCHSTIVCLDNCMSFMTKVPIIKKPVHGFPLQINKLVSIWKRPQSWNCYIHCMESDRIRSFFGPSFWNFFWSVFTLQIFVSIPTAGKYWPEKLRIWTLFTHCYSQRKKSINSL